MTPTQHFGDLHVAFAQLLIVGSGRSLCSKATPGVRPRHHSLPAQPQANEQVENANYQYGEQEEGQRSNQDDQVVDPHGLDYI